MFAIHSSSRRRCVAVEVVGPTDFSCAIKEKKKTT